MMASRARASMRGLYAVTPDTADIETLLRDVDAAIAGGARVVQHRNKSAPLDVLFRHAKALQALCQTRGVPFIVNDNIDIARDTDAAGVHIGAEDGTLESARHLLGSRKIIGVSCYNNLANAVAAERGGADYVAFGSFFSSTVKPGAVRASLDLLVQARRALSIPVVAIGGITVENAAPLLAAGADAIAVISDLFCAAGPEKQARRFAQLFATADDAQR